LKEINTCHLTEFFFIIKHILQCRWQQQWQFDGGSGSLAMPARLAVVWWQCRWWQLGGNMAAELAAQWWRQPSGGGSVAAAVWQHWGGRSSTAAVVAAAVLRSGGMAAWRWQHENEVL
jgi:hypothetical protein